MAVSYWTGGTDGDLSDATNWVGGVPGTTDTAVFNDGTVSVDPSLGALDPIGSIEIYPGYKGSIGGSGNAWSCNVETHIKHFGHADFWWESGTADCPDVFIACARNDVVVNLDGDGTFGADEITLLRGAITMAGSLGPSDLVTVEYVDNPIDDVTLIVVSNSNDITLLHQIGSKVELNAEASTYFMQGGYCVVPYGANGKILNGRFTGGVFRHFSTNQGTNVTQVRARNCVYDLGRGAKTITHLIEGPGLELLRSDIHTITTHTYMRSLPSA